MKKKALIVDLDGTLIKSDLLIESFFNAISKNLLIFFYSIIYLIFKGKYFLKKYLYENSEIEISNLPYNSDVLDFILNWKKENPKCKVILVTASYHEFAKKVFNHLKIFDDYYGSEKNINLKGNTKLNFIKKITLSFDYIGDSYADKVIWRKSDRAIIVSNNFLLLSKLKKINSKLIRIPLKNYTFYSLIKMIRMYQWVKNILIFLPLILAQKFDYDSILSTSIAFLSFSLVASSFYIFNDLLDIENDRIHDDKRFRMIPSGHIPITHSSFYLLIMLFTGLYIAININLSFFIIVIVYSILTSLYSLLLKSKPIIDIITLTSLYTVRIIAGGTVNDIELSIWLLSFSIFFFTFLASIKRQQEILKSEDKISGRGYNKSDYSLISQISLSAGYISIIILMLYLDSTAAENYYKSNNIFFCIPLILLFWITHICFITQKGLMRSDPILYILKDSISYFSFLLIIIFFYLSVV